jgi:hypothetical protein
MGFRTKLNQFKHGDSIWLQDDYEIRFDLEDFKGNKAYAKYSIFSVADASTKISWSGKLELYPFGICSPPINKHQLGTKETT